MHYDNYFFLLTATIGTHSMHTYYRNQTVGGVGASRNAAGESARSVRLLFIRRVCGRVLLYTYV